MKKVLGVIIVFILLVNCNKRLVDICVNVDNNVNMEKLNIKKIETFRDKLIASKKRKSDQISKDKETRIFLTDDGNVNYIEKDLKNGNEILISGNKDNGYKKTEFSTKLSTEKYSEFFSNGKLKCQGENYRAKKGKDPDGFSRSIGKWYWHDEEGNILKTIEYDESNFYFSIDDIQKYIEEEKLNVHSILILPCVIIDGEKTSEPKWQLGVSDNKNPMVRRIIIIDGKTGNVLQERTQRIKK